jgi:hypothetical protein
MRKIDVQTQIAEDLLVAPGTGATMSVGSDAYPYWITEVLPNRVFGICHAKSHFDDQHPWEGGIEVVDPFNEATDKTQKYIKRCYGKWWEVSKDGKTRIARFSSKWNRFSIGHACGYRDPSF